MNNIFKEEIFNISNFLSIFRFLLVFPISFFLLGPQESRFIAVIIGIIAVITDGLDGYFARKYNQTTDLGKIIDPLADKVLMGVVTIILVLKEMIPLWFLFVILIKDLLILFGGLYMKNRKNIVPQSNYLGKITAGVIAFYLIVTIIIFPEFETVRVVLLWVATLFSLISFISYSMRFVVSVTKQEK